MVKRILLLFFLCPWGLFAQNTLDIGIFNNPVNSNKLEVRLQPNQNITAGLYSAGVFTVRFPLSYGVALTAPPIFNSPLFNYTVANQGNDGTYQYYSFAFVSSFTVNWQAGIAYPIAIIEVLPGSGGGMGTFEIINNAWTAANNGDVYQELNGQIGQGIIYQATATAPLGNNAPDITPPTITCTENKTVATTFHQCTYTQAGTGWNALGTDNFPGFTITYVRTGANNDTLFNLANAVFNKGLTTVRAVIRDGVGLADTCTFTVTVNDTQPPTILAPPTVLAPANASACTATNVLLGTPVPTDNCPGVQFSNNAPASFPKGNTVVVWTATDAAGLTASATQVVTVQSSLAASAVNLSSTLICSGSSTSLSFVLTGGIAPYTVVYNVNGTNSTATAYSSNQPITVSPLVTTNYVLVSVTDAIGCSITPTGLSRSVIVKPSPTLVAITPSAASVCLGASVSMTASGLLPGVSNTFQYTLNGTPGTQEVFSNNNGLAIFLTNSYPAGTYNFTLSSISVTGCSASFNSSTTFSVDATSPACQRSISGACNTATGNGVTDVRVDLEETSPTPAFQYSDISDSDGLYGFSNTIPPGSQVKITPYKNDNHLNGVSTFDLVLISKHILGLQVLDSPYKIIAADANHSGVVTTADIVDLRKMILGIVDELPSNTSWRFVRAGHSFQDPADPFSSAFPEFIAFNPILNDQQGVDFIGVKIGDVNATVISGAAAPAEQRSAPALFIDVREITDERRDGALRRFSFCAEEALAGFQFTLEMKGLEIIDVLPGAQMHREDFGVFPTALTTSFFTSEKELSTPPQFTLLCRPISSGLPEDQIQLSGRITPIEAFAPNAYPSAPEMRDLQLRFLEKNTTPDVFQVEQNQPNPFSENTSISFYLPEAGEVTISVYDEQGAVVLNQKEYFNSGQNTYTLDGTLLPAAGILFYKVQTLDNYAARRMLRF